MEASIPKKIAHDPLFGDLNEVPAGAVRAYGYLFNRQVLAYVQWQDGKLTEGTIDGEAAINAAVEYELNANLPAVYVGPASVADKAKFMATCFSTFRDCEFSEAFPVTHDNDVRTDLKDPETNA